MKRVGVIVSARGGGDFTVARRQVRVNEWLICMTVLKIELLRNSISFSPTLSLSLYNLLPFLSSLPHLLTILVFINRYPDGVSSYLSIKHQYNVCVCVYIIHVSICITCTVYAQSVGLTLFQICAVYQVVLSVLVSYTGTVPVDASMGGCGRKWVWLN